MPLFKNADNDAVQYGGGFRVFWRDLGAAAYEEVGHMTDLKETRNTSKGELAGSRNAARSPIKTRVTENVSGISLTPITLNSEVIRMAAMASGWVADNQAAGSVDLTALTVVADGFVEIAHRDAFITKIVHGTVSGGPFDIGETVTGGTSTATGKVAWVGSGFLELINVDGDFSAGETLTGGTSTATATSTSVQELEDIVLVDAATPTKRYALGTDYDLDLDAAMVLKKSTGEMGETAYVAYQHPAILAEIAYRDSGSSIITKEVKIEPDKDNDGPRITRHYPKVEFSPSSEWAILTDADAAASITFEGTVVEDSTKPNGQRFGKFKVFK